MAEPAARVEGLIKRFEGAGRAALAGVTASVEFNRITGLVGPDGAGKTTLIRLLAGLLHPSDGVIEVLGHDPVHEAAAIHVDLGYMPQRFGLYEDLSVAENLRLYADLRGLARAERAATFERLLHFTDLGRFTDRRAGALSGGMKQKLGLACALLERPRLLLLDEPSVGVDPISRRELWQMVNELVDDGVAVVWSTAYLDEAERCDEVILLNEGELIFAGAPGDLTQRVHGRVFALRGIHGAQRRRVLSEALANEAVADGVIQGSAVRLTLRHAHENAAHAIALGDLAPGASMEPVVPRFEDAFVDALGGGPGGRSALAEAMPAVHGGDDPVIRAEGLTRRFGEFTAADHVTFDVPRGEIFGLLGPNGAGKSTTFRMMCGLLRPSEGHARVDGMDLETAAGQARARIGYMAQKFSLYGQLSVRQNLAFFAGAYGLRGQGRREAVSRMVAIFGLTPHLDVNADTLALGFKQRLALACALMHQPAVLFLDEPTSGVDPITRREFWTHINGLVDKGVTVVVTTHFMDEAEYCDRIGLISHGRLVTTGAPDELKARAASDELPDPTLEDAFIALVEAREAA